MGERGLVKALAHLQLEGAVRGDGGAEKGAEQHEQHEHEAQQPERIAAQPAQQQARKARCRQGLGRTDGDVRR